VKVESDNPKDVLRNHAQMVLDVKLIPVLKEIHREAIVQYQKIMRASRDRVF
jgi:hypothetical protein